MEYDVLIAAILIVAFFMCIKAYTLGFKHGKSVCNGISPQVNINPVRAVKQRVQAHEEKKKDDLALEGLMNIANYDPYKTEGGE